MEKNGNEKTELKLQKKYTLSNNWNAYGPFFKQPVFLAAAFAFGCGFFLAAAFAFDWLIGQIVERHGKRTLDRTGSRIQNNTGHFSKIPNDITS